LRQARLLTALLEPHGAHFDLHRYHHIDTSESFCQCPM
jgi:hypothetical protein